MHCEIVQQPVLKKFPDQTTENARLNLVPCILGSNGFSPTEEEVLWLRKLAVRRGLTGRWRQHAPATRACMHLAADADTYVLGGTKNCLADHLRSPVD